MVPPGTLERADTTIMRSDINLKRLIPPHSLVRTDITIEKTDATPERADTALKRVDTTLETVDTTLELIPP